MSQTRQHTQGSAGHRVVPLDLGDNNPPGLTAIFSPSVSTLQPLLHTDPPRANCGNICASLLCPQQPKNCIKKRKWKRKRKELFEILKSQLHKTWEKRVQKPRGVGSLSPLSCFNTFTSSGMCKVLGTLPGCFYFCAITRKRARSSRAHMLPCTDGTALPTRLDTNTQRRYSKTSLSQQHERLVVLEVSRSKRITGDVQRNKKNKTLPWDGNAQPCQEI